MRCKNRAGAPAAPVQQETVYQQPIQSPSDFQTQPQMDFNYPPQNGAEYQQQYYPPEQNQPELPMKWYKFTIYFALFAGSLMNLISAIMAFTGASYMTPKRFIGSMTVCRLLICVTP